MKFIFFGNQQILIDCIEITRKIKNAEVLFVVGCETEADKKLGYPSIRKYCKSQNIPYENPEKLKKEFLFNLQKLEPDYCMSIFYRKILGPSYIALPKSGFFNMHPSLLPAYRGPVPTMWALLNGELETGVTFHFIDTGIDTGDIVAQMKFNIPRNITGFDLNTLAMEKGTQLFKREIKKIMSNKISIVKQNHRQSTYYGPFRNHLRKIDWARDYKYILRQIRAFAKPYSGAYAEINGKEVIFWKASYAGVLTKQNKGPGFIIDCSDSKLVITTVDGLMQVDSFTPNIKFEAGQRFAL